MLFSLFHGPDLDRHLCLRLGVGRGDYIRAELHGLGTATRMADTGADALRHRLEERLAGWRGLLGRQVGEARQTLCHLLVGRLTFTPREDGGGRFYAFEGRGSVSALLSGIVTAEGMVTPGGGVLPEIPFTIILQGRLAA